MFANGLKPSAPQPLGRGSAPSPEDAPGGEEGSRCDGSVAAPPAFGGAAGGGVWGSTA